MEHIEPDDLEDFGIHEVKAIQSQEVVIRYSDDAQLNNKYEDLDDIIVHFYD